MDFKTTINNIMRIFSEEYPGKFSVTESRKKVWLHILKGFPTETILGAAYHLISTRPDWPPDIATMRDTVINFIHGELHQPTPQEAWENILRKIQDDDVELSDLEKAALKQVSTVYDLRRSENSSSDRAQYIKAFDQLLKKQQLERATLPAVKRLVQEHVPMFIEPEKPQELPEAQPSPLPGYEDDDYNSTLDDGSERVPPEEIRAFAKKFAKAMDLKESSDRERRRAEKEALDRR